jgi:hypothetical protein
VGAVFLMVISEREREALIVPMLKLKYGDKQPFGVCMQCDTHSLGVMCYIRFVGCGDGERLLHSMCVLLLLHYY